MQNGSIFVHSVILFKNLNAEREREREREGEREGREDAHAHTLLDDPVTESSLY